MASFCLHLITDRARTFRGAVDDGRDALIDAVARAVAGGVDWVQIREKAAPAREVLDTVEAVQRLTEGTGCGVIVNDRVDAALAAGADGVHLAKRSLPPERVRPLLPTGMLMGASVHSVEEAVEAERRGVDYVTFGHVFPTDSKPGLPPRGLEALQEVVESVPVPVLAIGGITVERLPLVLETGCAGVALIGGVMAAEDPVEAVRALRRILDESPARPRYPFPQPPALNAPVGNLVPTPNTPE